MVANTGTYLDTPFHRFADGVDLSGLTLEQLVDLEGVTVDVTASKSRAIGPEVFEGLSLFGCAVLVQTGWDRHWATESYGSGHPYLTAAAAEALVAARPALVGIDSLNIDDGADGSRPAHTKLLAASIPIVEHMTNLSELPTGGFRFTAAPPLVAGMGTWPVRAYATIED